MSKRHIFEQSGGGDPTLVFYAPLTEGDLYDHISGQICEVQSGGTITWDSQLNAYHFTKSRGLNGCAWWRNLNLNIDIVNWGFTLVADYGAAQNGTDESKYRSIDFGGRLGSGNARVVVQPNLHLSIFGTATNTLHRIAVKLQSSDAKGYLFAEGYRNNEFVLPSSLNSVWTDNCNVFKRDTTVSDDTVKTLISVGRSDTSGTAQATNVWVRNLRVYKRELTIEEILTI